MVTFLMIESDNLLVGCCATVRVSGKAGSFVFIFAVEDCEEDSLLIKIMYVKFVEVICLLTKSQCYCTFLNHIATIF